MNTTYRQNKKNASVKNPFYFIAAGIIVLLLIVGGLEVTHTTSFFHKKRVITAVTGTQTTKGEPLPGTPTKAQTSPDMPQPVTSVENQPGDTKSNTVQNSVLTEPSGNFVSAHKNVPLDAPLSSVCNTTPGASCQIRFTLANVTKSLSVQTTDRGGATYWNSWTPTSIGLTSGSWRVEAFASLNGVSKSSIDALPLEIK